MTKKYKLSANYNTVELDITEEDLLAALEVLPCEEPIRYTEEGEPIIPYEYYAMAYKYLLQKEYDILSAIKVVPPIAPAKPADPNKPSEKQCIWARNLGMKNPEKHTKKEVWQYIQDHQDDED